MVRVLTAAILVCLLATSGATAQDPTGAIEGTITDRTAAVVAGAHLLVTNVDTGFTREATTGPTGSTDDSARRAARHVKTRRFDRR